MDDGDDGKPRRLGGGEARQRTHAGRRAAMLERQSACAASCNRVTCAVLEDDDVQRCEPRGSHRRCVVLLCVWLAWREEDFEDEEDTHEILARKSDGQGHADRPVAWKPPEISAGQPAPSTAHNIGFSTSTTKGTGI